MDTELPVQRLGIVADDIKTTALHGALWPEGTDDHMASMPDSSGDLADIGDTVARGSKKMKDGAVVPHVVSGRRQFHCSDIRSKPMYAL